MMMTMMMIAQVIVVKNFKVLPEKQYAKATIFGYDKAI